MAKISIYCFDPSIGTEITKTRPALIISPTEFNQVRSKITLLPISSTAIKAKKISPVVVVVVLGRCYSLLVTRYLLLSILIP